MIQITKEEWDSIHEDYKGRWEKELVEYRSEDIPDEYIGKREVMSGCISNMQGSLLTEGVHFEILD